MDGSSGAGLNQTPEPGRDEAGPKRREHRRTWDGVGARPRGHAGDAVYARRSACLAGVPVAGRHLRCRKHGRKTPEYSSYTGAVARCHDPRDKDYRDYGARGIRVCDAWRDPRTGFDAFVDHVGQRPTRRHTLGRIDNARGYEPGNVRWETWTQQQNNRRSTHYIEIDGVRKSAADWAREAGLPRRQVVTNRVAAGWHPTAAVRGAAGETKSRAHIRLGLKPKWETVFGPPKGTSRRRQGNDR